MAQTVHFITRGSGEATFINHTFMVILGDKVDVSNADANACAPKGNLVFTCGTLHFAMPQAKAI